MKIIIDQHTIISHHQHISHGNIKLSNILLYEDQEPLISEYGLSTILDPKRFWSFSSTGYTAPEKTLSEQGDVFSFGIIMLELLTGKTVEKSGIELPKWVRSIVSQNHRIPAIYGRSDGEDRGSSKCK
ncbi:TYROSINE KINASE FAMILY PROTEIN [Salix koriyanagi]|uniref:TYROSINE KINASE FAMILY PROTEIN n=1 Tax=Salix koriyanagi TaxID=2511006 RepID=A0A9Q0ZBG3_9ROSI|nr:TYROSINE KINASE FAMILY PROTEIN [Salix koriyanagi]